MRRKPFATATATNGGEFRSSGANGHKKAALSTNAEGRLP